MTTFAKASALVVGFVAAMALGVWVGPHITNRGRTITEATTPTAEAPASAVERPQPAPVKTRRTAEPRRATKPEATATATTTTTTISASAPEVQQRLKPLLNRGANMSVASQEFRDAEQFAVVAHAARNTDVPFMVLKHRVVDEGKSLPEAIRELKPGLDATEEAARARDQAKSDIASIQG